MSKTDYYRCVNNIEYRTKILSLQLIGDIIFNYEN